jgi:hypothetical protein
MMMNRVARALGKWLSIAALLVGGLWPAAGAAPSSDRLSLRIPRGAGTAGRLIDRLWDSGFFRRSPAVRDEICNNSYAFFDPRSPLAALQKKGMACFSRGPDGKDTIYLREDIFAHYRVDLEGILVRRSVESTALKVLVHELCHDFWINLLDERERDFFALDGAAFIADYQQALLAEERQEFLFQAGQTGRESDLTDLCSEFDVLIASYPPALLYGPELFAWFGERAFSIGLKIPPTFRRYYTRLISITSVGSVPPSS